MQGCQAGIVHELEGIFEHLFRFGRKARDEVGAERNVRPQPADFFAKSNRVFSRVPPLHALQDKVVAGLGGKMEMRREPFFFRNHAHEIGIGFDGVK